MMMIIIMMDWGWWVYTMRIREDLFVFFVLLYRWYQNNIEVQLPIYEINCVHYNYV